MSGLDDMHRFMAELDSAPWHRKAWWSVRRQAKALIRSPRTARIALRLAGERLSRGWDQRALWSLDHHLSTTLGAQLTEMGRIAHGWPGSYPGGFEAWTADLAKHGAALSTYGATDDSMPDADRDSIRANAKTALHWVADNLGSLWD